MLERDYRTQLDELLATSECAVQIPRKLKQMLARRGVVDPAAHERRRFVRSYYPLKAILELNQSIPGVERSHKFFGVVTKDLSRSGIAFFHSAELYPGERFVLWLPSGKLECHVARCVCHNPACFEIGTAFSTCDELASV